MNGPVPSISLTHFRLFKSFLSYRYSTNR
jgi:hypothetical protein